MKIALDFDGTYTADPAMWDKVIAIVKEHGHEIVCVSSRFPGNPPTGIPLDIVCCSFEAKARAIGDIDIWIDDNPWSIHIDYPRDPSGNVASPGKVGVLS